MNSNGTSNEDLSESTPEVADVPKNETSVLESSQGCVTRSDVILNLDTAREGYALRLEMIKLPRLFAAKDAVTI